MLTLLLKRIVGLFLTLFIVSAFIFFFMSLLPGDPAAIMLGTSASPDTLAALQKQMGLDQPLMLRYTYWLSRVLTGDFGQSYTYGTAVSEIIFERLTVTLPLAFFAVVLAICVGVPLGLLAARFQNKLLDHLVSVVSQFSIAVPGFWVGLLLIMLFASSLGWFPAGGFPGWENDPLAAFASLILPSIALALSQAGVLTRVTRSSVLEVLREDYVRTAHSKGLSAQAVVWKHALPNALIPVVTMIGLQITFLIAGAVLVENVFNLPGLGRLALQALAQRDIIVLQAVVLLFCCLVIVMNFIVELAYVMIDPRLKHTA